MSTFNHFFRVTTYGESHCPSVGVIVDGVPPGLQLSEADIQPQMTRRRPGQSALTTPRDEKDKVIIQSGVENGKTLGTPVSVLVRNEDQRPHDYGSNTMDTFPSSARETIGRVIAGTIAELYLSRTLGIEIIAFVSSVGTEELFPPTATHPSPSTNPTYLSLLSTITREEVDSFLPVRSPNAEASDRMASTIAEFRDKKDSIGGTVTCVIRNSPVGLGEPCFDKLEACLAQAMLSIPATKGFEIGSGFAGTSIPGSLHNDAFIAAPAIPPSQSGVEAERREGQGVEGVNGNGMEAAHSGKKSSSRLLKTKTNNSGGIQGGITNGAPIYFRVAFKPPATIGQAQSTTTFSGEVGTLEAKGRHDPCVVPRAVPIVEAMAALVMMDALMAQDARNALRARLPGPIEDGFKGEVNAWEDHKEDAAI